MTEEALKELLARHGKEIINEHKQNLKEKKKGKKLTWKTLKVPS